MNLKYSNAKYHLEELPKNTLVALWLHLYKLEKDNQLPANLKELYDEIDDSLEFMSINKEEEIKRETLKDIPF